MGFTAWALATVLSFHGQNEGPLDGLGGNFPICICFLFFFFKSGVTHEYKLQNDFEGLVLQFQPETDPISFRAPSAALILRVSLGREWENQRGASRQESQCDCTRPQRDSGKASDFH